MVLDPALDIFWLGKAVSVATRTRNALTDLRRDLAYLDSARRAVLPLPTDPRPVGGSPFPVDVSTSLPALAGRRVSVSATGGSGAMASLLGVLRAFEEAGLRPAALSVCSGSALFGFPWAAGVPADDVADFLLRLHPGDYVDPDWRRLATLVPTLGRGFGGIVRGEAIEAALLDWLGDITLGDLEVPCYSPAWQVEENRLVFLGPRTFPELTVARAIRVSIALPLFFAPVPLDDGWYCDGGVVDVFPVRPLLELEPPPDAALAVNCFWPTGLTGEERHGWQDEAFSLLGIESQVRTANHLQHSRDNLDRLHRNCPTVLLEPVPYATVHGSGLTRHFVDSSRWPQFMMAGLVDGRQGLRTLAELLSS